MNWDKFPSAIDGYWDDWQLPTNKNNRSTQLNSLYKIKNTYVPIKSISNLPSNSAKSSEKSIYSTFVKMSKLRNSRKRKRFDTNWIHPKKPKLSVPNPIMNSCNTNNKNNNAIMTNMNDIVRKKRKNKFIDISNNNIRDPGLIRNDTILNNLFADSRNNQKKYEQKWLKFEAGNKIDCRGSKDGKWFSMKDTLQTRHRKHNDKITHVYVHNIELDKKCDELIIIRPIFICDCNDKCDNILHTIAIGNTESEIKTRIKDKKWYSKNDNGLYEPVEQKLCNIVSNIKKDNFKKYNLYSLNKISYNYCTQKNAITGKQTELRLEEYGWYYADNNMVFQPYGKQLNGLIQTTFESKHKFKFVAKNGYKYQLRQITQNKATQKNLKTGKIREVIYKLRFETEKRNNQNGIFSFDNIQNIINHNSEFKSHLTYEEARKLQIGNKIDFRSRSGYVYGTQISNVEIRENDKTSNLETWIKIDNKWININTNNIYKIAKYGSISQRPSHRLKHLNVGDHIDVNPIYHSDTGWKAAQIIKIDSKSGQVGVKFMKKRFKKDAYLLYWVHLDNNIECDAYGKGKINKNQAGALFFSTVSPSKYEISEIKDISNKDSINVYESLLKAKCKNGENEYEMERFLFHGIRENSESILRSILRNGFDRSYNNVGYYGKGTYFAKHSKYCVDKKFCGKDKDDMLFILVCRVIVGDYTKGSKDLEKIPIKENGIEYDSLVNDVEKPTIFVIWRDFVAIPYYLIKFKCIQ